MQDTNIVIGRKGDQSELIKEESVLMDPVAPDFLKQGSSIIYNQHNITLKTTKSEKALQDSFLVEYRQIEPDQRYPVLEVLDILEQKDLEIYLGNLNPGHDYAVQVTSVKDGVKSRPWSTTLTTSMSILSLKPSKVSSLSVVENSSCVVLQWELSPRSGGDEFVIHGVEENTDNGTTVSVTSSTNSVELCNEIVPGASYIFSVVVKKSDSISETASIKYNVRPLPPWDFKVGEQKIEKNKAKLLKSFIKMYLWEHFGGALKSALVYYKDYCIHIYSCTILLSLSPGERFEFTVSTSSNNVSSIKVQRSVVLTPAFDMNGFGLSIQEAKDGIEMSWPQSDVFMSRMKDLWNKAKIFNHHKHTFSIVVGAESVLHLRVSPMSHSTQWKERTKQFESSPFHPSSILVSSLRNGACYKIKIQLYTVTKSGIVSESRYNESMRISAPPVSVSLDNVTRTSGTLQLTMITQTVQSSDVNSETVPDCQLHIVVLDMHSQVVFDKHLQLATTMPQIDLNGLRPFHKYTINTKIICGITSAECPPSTRTMRQISFSTRQDRPGPVLSLTVRTLNPYSVQLSWLPPALPNGILTHYVIEIKPEDINQPPWSVNVGLNTDRADHFLDTIIDGLNGGENYTFIVRAVTEAGLGDDPEIPNQPVSMPIMAPPRPSIAPQVVVDSISSYSLSLRYSSSIFDPKHGRIVRSAVIVSEVTEDGRVSETWMTAENVTYTWAQVQRFDIWPAYTAAVDELPPQIRFAPTRIVTEAVGIDQSCGDLPADSVCNGPLKAGTPYKFKLRLYTASNLFTDTLFSNIVVTEPLPRGVTLKTAIIVLSVLVLVGALGVIFITYWNRSKKARTAYSSSSKESQWAALKMIMAERAADCLAKLGLDGSQNMPRGCRSLRERTGVDHRLERLPSGPIHKTPLYTVITGVNTSRNRPVRIADFPEHLRMMSADSEFRFSEEYEGFSSRREFIAAQGPLPSTRDAFWQMAWEQHCPAIIALTKCVEKGRDKCHQYWPDAEHMSVFYADIEVTLMCETHYEEFTIRELRLTKLNDNSPPRTIRHFHYMAWPDFGAPEHPDGIIKFVCLYRSKLPHSPQNKPTIVHCSAGVGRSGTFIAIDRLLQTIQLDRPIDVFGIVHEMRLERCHMVQNEQQYIFIHHCILHAIQLGSAQWVAPSVSETHQNPAFEDDEGIAESGF
uniref:Protein-tyrosine-phosphatase n=1 Tax=Heterorhabditis bacteriophora TaxID=37862 RepID=A0A1I7X9F5_HETBA